MKAKYLILLLPLYAILLSANPIPGEYPLAFGYTPDGNGPSDDWFRFYLASYADFDISYDMSIYNDSGEVELSGIDPYAPYSDTSLFGYTDIYKWNEYSTSPPFNLSDYLENGGYLEPWYYYGPFDHDTTGDFIFGDYGRTENEAITITRPLSWSPDDWEIEAGPFPDSCYLWVRTFVRRIWTPPWDDIPITSYDFCNYMHIPEEVLDTIPFGHLPISSAPESPQITEINLRGANRFIELYNSSSEIFNLNEYSLINFGRCDLSDSLLPGEFEVVYDISWGDIIVDSTGGGIAIVKRDDDGIEHFCTGVAWGNWTDASKSLTWTGDSGWVARPPSPGVIETSIAEKNHPLPSAVAILSAQPNPFNASATIGYEIARGVLSTTLDIFDINGRLIRSRELSDTRPGYHETKIAALPSSGTYLVRIETNRGSDERKITFLK